MKKVAILLLLCFPVFCFGQSDHDLISAVFGAHSIMHRVFYCESGGRQYYDNGELIVSPTHDFGIAQISWIHEEEATRLGYDIMTPVGNVLFAKYLYNRNGINDWYASNGCHHALD